jgi:lambda repressor-like predicted transcriptional regulator
LRDLLLTEGAKEEKMDEEANRIRGAMEGLKRGRRERIPDTIRAAVKSYARKRRAKGASWRQLSAAVGLSSESLRRFAAESGARNRRLVAVSLRPEPARRDEGLRGLVLVTAQGMRLEGLGVAEAVELLRALT